MTIQLLLFAQYREFAGTDQLAIELPAGATAADAVRAVRARDEGSARIPAEPAVAVNQAYAALDVALADGDEVALLPPIAGG